MAILKIRDANGNVQEIPVIKGDRGERGPQGIPGEKGDPAKEEWITIADETIEEDDVVYAFKNKDIDGNPFECKKLTIQLIAPTAFTGSIWTSVNSGFWGARFGRGIPTNFDVREIYITYELASGKYTEIQCSFNSGSNNADIKEQYYWSGDSTSKFIQTQDDDCKKPYKGIRVGMDWSNDSTVGFFPMGTTIKVWGLKA